LGDEIFSELEQKIDSFCLKIQQYKQEKNDLKLEIEEQKGIIGNLESENQTLKKELEEAKNNYLIRQRKLDAAAEKIQSLLNKLESVEE
jgi:chromosome segregation ATPase